MAAVEEVDKHLQAMATPCTELSMIQQVATISANGEVAVGEIIKNAFEAVGSEGVITVDEGGGTKHTLDVVDGFQFRRGAEAQDRFFNNRERTQFEAEGAHVVLYDGKLQNTSQSIVHLKSQSN